VPSLLAKDVLQHIAMSEGGATKYGLNPNPHGSWLKRSILFRTEQVVDALSKIYF
jgi:hypothetical protein